MQLAPCRQPRGVLKYKHFVEPEDVVEDGDTGEVGACSGGLVSFTPTTGPGIKLLPLLYEVSPGLPFLTIDAAVTCGAIKLLVEE